MKPRLLIPLLLLPVACGPKEPAPAASAVPPSTVAAAPSPLGASLLVEVVMIDTAAPSITLREGEVAAGTPKASDLKTATAPCASSPRPRPASPRSSPACACASPVRLRSR